ncbi:MAG: ABC transporter ATP-binding protein/permease [Firmicutes bacterium]|nr:ABC transporter ATP-binding protein/permease [Bacillota bacterium]
MTKKVPLRQKPIFRVLGYFKSLRWRVLALICVGLIGIALFSMMPTYTNAIFNTLESSILDGINPTLSSILRYIVIFAVLALFNEVFQLFAVFFIIKHENSLTAQMKTRVKQKLDTLPISYLENFATGDISRRVANLSGQIVRTLLMGIFRLSRAIFFFIITAIAMFSINWILALVVISSLPLSILAARFVSGKTQKYFNRNNQILLDTIAYAEQRISLHDFYKTHGLTGGEEEYEQFNRQEAKGTTAEETATFLNAAYIVMIQNFMLLLVTVVFGILFINGNVPEFGALPAFLVFSNRFLANAVIVTESTNILQLVNARAPKVFEILDHPDLITEDEHIDIFGIGEIEFKNVTSVHRGEIILDDVSFVIPKGSSVAIVGPTGNGKGRIVELLAKLEETADGKVLIDGVDLKQIHRQSYYDKLGIAFEKPFIFRGTVAENLLYGVRRTLPEYVMNVTKKVGGHEFIEQLPEKYETQVSEKSSLLSNSQRQALNVARTVLKASDLVVFHQAMSAADTVTEKQAYERIISLYPKQTKVFVTHRLASIENCDQIIFLDHGKIIERGTHTELMRQKGRYYEAYQSH